MATIHGSKAIIYEYRHEWNEVLKCYVGKCRCYIPEAGITAWYNIEDIQLQAL